MSTAAPILGMETNSTHYVEWMTYASSGPNVGLGEFLAHHILGAPAGYEIEILEAGNNSSQSIDIALTDYELGETRVMERAGLITKLQADYARETAANAGVTEDWKRKRYVGVETYKVRTLMMAALERGWLQPGSYVVSVSW